MNKNGILFRTFIAPRKRREANRLLEGMKPDLADLRNKMEALGRALKKETVDPLDLIVTFFAAIAPWHDRGFSDLFSAFEDAGDQIPECIELLALRIRNAGRDKSGWNQTDPGEKVTADTIFIGGIYGLKTKKVSYWQSVKNESRIERWKGTIWEGSTIGMNSYDVIARHTRSFLESHVFPMIEILDELTIIRRVA